MRWSTRVCDACRVRKAHGFGYRDKKACSMLCLDTLAKGRGMVDPDDDEQAALDFASQMAGEYVESLGKTDLATFTSQEWATLVECAVTGYQDKLAEMLNGAAGNGRDDAER
jgi:hypothetical protein